MKKMTREEFVSIVGSRTKFKELWNHIDSLQSELEALEGRTWLDSVNEMIDWKNVVGPHIDIVGYQKSGATIGRFGIIHRPIPAQDHQGEA